MRVAFVGKGGAGKSVVAGTFARLLAGRGERVLAVDSDPMPGLSLSLGLGVVETAIPEDAVQEQDGTGPRYRLRTGLDAAQAVERYALAAPDGVRLLQFGKLRGHAGRLTRSQSAFRQILAELPRDRWNLVGDLPGGTRQPFFGWASYASTVVVVVEPTAKSVLSARRLARIAHVGPPPDRVVCLANKVRDEDEPSQLARRTGLDVIAAVPWDDTIRQAEREGRAPVDVAPRSAMVRAVESLVDRLTTTPARAYIDLGDTGGER